MRVQQPHVTTSLCPWALNVYRCLQGGGEVSVRIPALAKLPPVSLTEEGVHIVMG